MNLLLIQVAIPPVPLPPQADPNVFSTHVQESILIALVIIAISAGVVVLLKPLVQALARRLEGRGVDTALRGEVEELRQQVTELEPLRDRVHELEERMEFSERLLAQRREQDLLPRQER